MTTRLASRPLPRLDLAAEAERLRRERLFTPHPDPAVCAEARRLVESGRVPDDTYASTYGRAVHDEGNTSDYARRRDARALAASSDGWTAQAVHLARAYDHALGWALAYGVAVFTVTEHGVHLRGLHDLVEAVRTAEAPIVEAQRQIALQAHLDEEMERILTASR